MWHCLNDVFGYCSGEPEVEEGEEIKSRDLTVVGMRCKLDPKTCGKFLKASEVNKPTEIKGEGYRHTTTAKTPEAVNQTSSPAKSKRKPKQKERLL